MPDHVSNHTETFSVPPLPPSFPIEQSEAAKSADRLRDEFFTDAPKPKEMVQQSLSDFFKALTEDMHRQVVESQRRNTPAVRTKAELQPNGCYSSPAYQSIIDHAAQRIYDPKELGDLEKMRHMYNCRINNDADAVKYAAQALKFDNDPYTALLLDETSAGVIGITMKMQSADRPATFAQASGKSVQEWLTVETVQPNGPAARAGMLPGDQVRFVDGLSMQGKSLAEVANILRGAADTVVEVSVMRQGALKKLEMTRVGAEVRPREVVTTPQAGIGAAVALLGKDLSQVTRDTTKTIGGKSESLTAQENDLVLANVVSGSPAERAGLRRGDIVRKVDGQPLTGLTVDGATAKIRGVAGRAVDLRILRAGKFVDVSIVRAPLRGEDVVSDRTLGDGISYIKYTDFMHGDGTKRLMDAMNRHSTAKAIVLDLRDNGGGLLDQALKNIPMFLWQGDSMKMDRRIPSSPAAPKYETTKYSVTGQEFISVTEDGVNNPRVERKRRDVPYLLNGRPLVILTNGNSASASELFAGALHDNGVAKLIGEKTLGKGIGQTYEEKGSYTQATTTFRYYTPKGFWPGDAHNNRVGISPDIAVQDSLSQGDPQLDTAIKYLKDIMAIKRIS